MKSQHKPVTPPRSKLPWWPIGVVMIGLVVLAIALIKNPPGNNSVQPPVTLEAHGTPALRVDKEKVDLGDVKLGQTVQVSFDVTNAGDQALRFNEPPYIEVIEGC